MFQLVEYCKISLTEAWSLPIPVRKWWIDRKNKEEEAKLKAKDRSKNPNNAHPDGHVDPFGRKW